jgi:hypothetical protein
MTRSFPRVLDVRKPLPAAVALLGLLLQVTACQPVTAPELGDAVPEEPTPNQPTPNQPTPDPSTNNPQVQTSPFTLTSAPPELDPPPERTPGTGAFRGVLTTDSALGTLDFRYDAYVITARETGWMTIQSDVLEANPNGYRYGYGYPLTMAAIDDGVTLTQYGGRYDQDALETGTAIISYPVEAGRQYILVYKTFGSFTPLTYRLFLPTALKVEGRIHAPPTPVPVPPISSGLITLENPRPDALSEYVPWLSAKVSGNSP